MSERSCVNGGSDLL